MPPITDRGDSIVKVAVNGAAGAMGRRVIALLAETHGCELAAALERPGHPDLGRDAGALAGMEALGVQLSAGLSGKPDVLIDFSAPEGATARARDCAERGVAVVIGTTGLSAEQLTEIRERVATKVPVLVAPNMSIGVNLLFRLAEDVARALGEGYDVEIVEAHHRRKKDAPSGTAMELARRVCRALGKDPQASLCYGRQGLVGPRKAGEVGVHAVRVGDIVGEHTVTFAGDGECVELVHKAGSRDVFARGAIRAAMFLVGKAPGVYSMQDVLR
jgi:4-hydroxy-tetrahydrodipicolinate reductase